MKKGILGVVASNFFAVFMCFYWIFALINPIEAKQGIKYAENTEKTAETSASKEEISSEKESGEEKSSQTENGESTVEAKTVSSKAVSAAAIKGNIISQYISPYNAPLSYNKVYLKNLTGQAIDIKKYLNSKLDFKISKNSSVQVLILHTHATETFKTDTNDYFTEDFTSRSRNDSQNMISIGKIVAEKLNAAGIKTVHDTTLHDYPSYTQSYSRSAETVSAYLKKYPTIKVVLDLHRDAVTRENGDKVKLVTQINGKTAAQVMLVMGSQTGGITNFPNWEKNLSLAVKLQQVMENKYPTLARPLMLASKNYNQSLSSGAMLLEFGTDVNTLEEAQYSAKLVGNCLVELLGELK